MIDVQKILAEATQIAQKLNNSTVTVGHVALSLLLDPEIKNFITKHANIHDIENALTSYCKKLPQTGQMSFAPTVWVWMQKAQQAPNAINALCFALQADEEIRQIFTNFNISENTLRHGQSSEILEKYTIDLTKQAESGKLDPFIGREEILSRVTQIIQRRIKNNPMLVGDAGVGKTAVVEGLAQRIVNRDVPRNLQETHVLLLNIATLLAGAKYRGEYEERVMAVIQAVTSMRAIVFIDEIHTLVGSGRTDSAMDAANMLKPALARGELRCIGATTFQEYKTYIEKDAALERRFQLVRIEEPSAQESIAILRGLKDTYGRFHNVDISDTAVTESVYLSMRYMMDRRLPDKAIDLIDEAASHVKIRTTTPPESLSHVRQQIVQLEIEKSALQNESGKEKRLKEIDHILESLKKEKEQLEHSWIIAKNALDEEHKLKQEIDVVRLDLENATRKGDLDRMALLKFGTLPKLEKNLKEKVSQRPQQAIQNKVTEIEIRKIIVQLTGIPLNNLTANEKEKLMNIASLLKESIIGQDHAIELVANTLKRSRAGISIPTKPIGSFLFIGPTGVGKTELCRILSKELFSNMMIRMDMSEFMEKHTVSRLIGAPPGYVGHEQGGYLTDRIRKNPYTCVLFDEIEKAHADVLNILLQIMDDGRLTDAKGKTADFKNTIIIMTSNASNIQKDFKPEFLNRIDAIIPFKELSKEDILRIVRLQIEELKDRIKDFSLIIDPEVIHYIAEIGFSKKFGARPIRRAIQANIETPLADYLLTHQVGEKIFCRLKENKIVCSDE